MVISQLRRLLPRADEEVPMSRPFLRVSALALMAALSCAAARADDKPASPPAAAPAEPSPVVPADPFGAEVKLEPRTFIYMKGTATWENAFETLVDSFKTITDYMEKQKLTASDKPLAIYTETDESGFKYQVGIPVAEAPKNPPK